MRRLWAAILLLLVAPGVAVGLLADLGTLGPGLPGLPSAGVVTRVGLPLVQALRDVASMLALGAMVIGLTCVPPDDGARGVLTGMRRRLVDLGARAALVWALLSLVLLAFTWSDAIGTPMSSAGFLDQVLFFGTNYELGKYLLVTTVFSALAGLIALSSRGPRWAGVGSLLALAAFWPMALTAHGAGSLRHDLAVDAQYPHLVAVAVWGGGLIALALYRGHLGSLRRAVVERYSTLATWCFVIVSAAGLAGGLIRLGGLSAIVSPYGALLVLKVAAVTLLGLLGLMQRRRLVRRIGDDEGGLGSLVLVEAVVMLSAAGLAVALNRTPPPTEPRPLTTAEDLLGYPLPDALDAADWFTAWEVDGFWLPIALIALAAYVAGVVRLRRRGDHWSAVRTVAWCAGWVVFIWATNGAPGAYGRVLFSMHMVQHMTIATAVPILLVLGAPVTLALRTLRGRRDGSMGAREWLLAVVHSPALVVLGHPVVAGLNFVASLVAFYYSTLLDLSLATHTGHVLMTAHFLLAGYLFASCLVGVDPGPTRPIFPLRVVMVMVVFGFHAFFSVSLMASRQVLAEDWFSGLARPWGGSLLEDQYVGASLGWALGDLPLAMVAAAMVALWVQADRRERRRFDRHEDRSGGAALGAYNEQLARMSGVARAADDEGSSKRPVNYDGA